MDISITLSTSSMQWYWKWFVSFWHHWAPPRHIAVGIILLLYAIIFSCLVSRCMFATLNPAHTFRISAFALIYPLGPTCTLIFWYVSVGSWHRQRPRLCIVFYQVHVYWLFRVWIWSPGTSVSFPIHSFIPLCLYWFITARGIHLSPAHIWGAIQPNGPGSLPETPIPQPHGPTHFPLSTPWFDDTFTLNGN